MRAEARSRYGPPPTPSTAWVVSGGGLGTGTVKSIAVSGSTAYLGGNFSYIGPATGGSAAFDTSSGAPISPWPQITGIVYAVVTDGSSGWYVGGDFDSIGTGHYDNLVHIKSRRDDRHGLEGDGTNGTSSRMLVSGSRVFAGGAFSTAMTRAPRVTRNALAAFDTTTGTVQNFNASVTDADGKAFVWAMAFSGNNLYFGGHSTRSPRRAGTTSRRSLPRREAAPCRLQPERERHRPSDRRAGRRHDLRRRRLHDRQRRVPQAATRLGLAAFNSTGFADGSWNPNPGNPQSGTTPRIDSLATYGSGQLAVIYAGGNFYTMGGQTRRSLAKISDGGTVDSSWNPDIPGPASVNRIVVSSDGQTSMRPASSRRWEPPPGTPWRRSARPAPGRRPRSTRSSAAPRTDSG